MIKKIEVYDGLFIDNLEYHFKKGYKEGLKEGSRAFVLAIKNMILNSHADIEQVLKFCNAALEENKEDGR